MVCNVLLRKVGLTRLVLLALLGVAGCSATLPASSFATGAPGGTGAGPPYEHKAESWNEEGAKREAEEAPRLEAERQAKHREAEERPAKEAAEHAVKEREAREAGERAGREAVERERLASAAMCRVPSLKGDSLAAARSALTKAHCKLGRVLTPQRRHGALIVTSQGSPSGTKLPRGAAVAVRLGTRRAAP